jgi:hypothetical protein
MRLILEDLCIFTFFCFIFPFPANFAGKLFEVPEPAKRVESSNFLRYLCDVCLVRNYPNDEGDRMRDLPLLSFPCS